jgi:hypothetical protein
VYEFVAINISLLQSFSTNINYQTLVPKERNIYYSLIFPLHWILLYPNISLAKVQSQRDEIFIEKLEGIWFKSSSGAK